MNLRELHEIKPIQDKYYLVENYEWSPSGFAIVQYDDGKFICEANGSEMIKENIEGILQLD